MFVLIIYLEQFERNCKQFIDTSYCGTADRQLADWFGVVFWSIRHIHSDGSSVSCSAQFHFPWFRELRLWKVSWVGHVAQRRTLCSRWIESRRLNEVPCARCDFHQSEHQSIDRTYSITTGTWWPSLKEVTRNFASRPTSLTPIVARKTTFNKDTAIGDWDFRGMALTRKSHQTWRSRTLCL